MKVITRIIVPALLIGAISFPLAASAASPDGDAPFGGFRRGNPMMMLKRVADRLNLTTEQRTEIRRIFRETRTALKPLRDAAQQAHRAVLNAGAAEPLNEQAIRDAVQNAATVHADLAVARARAFAQVRAVLTPDQRTQLAAMRAKFQARLGDVKSGAEQQLDSVIDGDTEDLG